MNTLLYFPRVADCSCPRRYNNDKLLNDRYQQRWISRRNCCQLFHVPDASGLCSFLMVCQTNHHVTMLKLVIYICLINSCCIFPKKFHWNKNTDIRYMMYQIENPYNKSSIITKYGFRSMCLNITFTYVIHFLSLTVRILVTRNSSHTTSASLGF